MAPLERVDLQSRQRVSDCVTTDRVDRDAYGPLGPGDHDERSEELRDVGVEDVVGHGELGEAEVDQPRLVIGRDEHVGAAEVSMCDAAVSEDRDLLPDAGHELVGDVRRIHAVDRLTRDRVVREEHRVHSDFDDALHARGADAGVAREQRHECLVLDGSPQRRERPVVADVLQAQEPVGAKEEVRRSLVLAEHLHEDLSAVGQRREVRRGPTRVDVRGPYVGDGEPRSDQRRPDRRQRRSPVGTSEREQHRDATRRAERHCHREARGQLGRDDEVQHHDDSQRGRAGSTPLRRDERAEHDELGGECRAPLKAPRADSSDASAVGDLVEQLVGMVVLEQPYHPRHQQRREAHGEEDVPEQAVALRRQGDREQRDPDEGREPLETAVDDSLDGRRQEVEQLDDRLLEPEHRILQPQRQHEREDGDETEDRQAQGIPRRALVAARLFLVDVDRVRARRDGLGDRHDASSRDRTGSRPVTDCLVECYART